MGLSELRRPRAPEVMGGEIRPSRIVGRLLKTTGGALVMYDRETESEWKQTRGEAINGPPAGQTLSVVPTSIATWQRFRAENPDGIVLQRPKGSTGDSRKSEPIRVYERAPYDRYQQAPGFGLREMRGKGRVRTWNRDDLDPKSLILGITDADEPVGYPLSRVQAAGGSVTDTVGSRAVLIIGTEDRLYAYEPPNHSMEYRNRTLTGDGVTWDPSTGRSEDDRTLRRASRLMYAFVWQDGHGPGSSYEQP